MNVFKKLVIGIWYYGWGNVFRVLYYDKKYISGRYFQGKCGGICAQGWRWLTYDGLSRLCSGVNKKTPWPVSGKVTVVNPENIEFDLDDLHIFHTYGTYFQGRGGKIIIGKGTWIAPNVGLITANHDVYNPDKHVEGKDIIIGKKCWIGMNSVILPGVVLGDNTIVGAGAIVTKSFKNGNCVIGGNPAKIIKRLDEELIKKNY